MWRKILGVIAGIITATLIFIAFEQISATIYPLPPGTDKANHTAMEVYAKRLPPLAFLLALAGWAIGSFICGIIVRIISGSKERTSAYIAGLFLTTAGIVDIFMLPHPMWFIITGIIIFIPMTLLGHAAIRDKNLSC